MTIDENTGRERGPIVPPTDNEAAQQQRPAPAGLNEPIKGTVVESKPVTIDTAGLAAGLSANPKKAPEKSSDDNMKELLDFLEERKAASHLPSKDDMEKMRRRKRTNDIISAIADGASAISNLIFTTKYAPNMYDHKRSMTEKSQERYDKFMKDYNADADRYLNYSLMIAKIKGDKEAKEYQRGRDALNDQLAQIRAGYNAKLADIRYRRQLQQLNDAQAAAEEREANRDLDRQIKEARRDVLKSQKDKNDRYQPASGRSNKPAEHAWRDKKGNLHYCHSESAARSQAAANDGVYVTTPTRRVTTKPNKYGDLTTTSSETDVSTTPKVTINWK